MFAINANKPLTTTHASSHTHTLARAKPSVESNYAERKAKSEKRQDESANVSIWRGSCSCSLTLGCAALFSFNAEYLYALITGVAAAVSWLVNYIINSLPLILMPLGGGKAPLLNRLRTRFASLVFWLVHLIHLIFYLAALYFHNGQRH